MKKPATVPSARSSDKAWERLNREIVACQNCPRLLAHCRQIASEKRAAYLDECYWGQPVPNFGQPHVPLLIVGLAPGAHGANRTGRMFTGDRSGLWLYRALHHAGFASQPSYERADDGQRLIDCAITAVCHCAPPGNRPTGEEIDNCVEFFARSWELADPRIVVALGKIAWDQTFRFAKSRGWWSGKTPRFAHAAEVALSEQTVLLGSYHPSQQNTFTGKLTEKMLDSVFRRARALCG